MVIVAAGRRILLVWPIGDSLTVAMVSGESMRETGDARMWREDVWYVVRWLTARIGGAAADDIDLMDAHNISAEALGSLGQSMVFGVVRPIN